MAIKEDIARFLKRVSDTVLLGRNGSRIVLGSDRKDTVDSGYGDGSENASQGAGSIDMVAGYGEENPNFDEDKSRIYLTAKGDPDDYLQMDLGENIAETAFIGARSDQLYIKIRKNIKIRNEKTTIIIDKDGNVTIETPEETKVKSGDSVILMKKDGNIAIGAESGTQRRILTEDDVCVGVDPTTGAIIQSKFTVSTGIDDPRGATVNNGKVKIVG